MIVRELRHLRRSAVLISKVAAMIWPPRLQERPVILPLLGVTVSLVPEIRTSMHTLTVRVHFELSAIVKQRARSANLPF